VVRERGCRGGGGIYNNNNNNNKYIMLCQSSTVGGEMCMCVLGGGRYDTVLFLLFKYLFILFSSLLID